MQLIVIIIIIIIVAGLQIVKKDSVNAIYVFYSLKFAQITT